MKISIIIPFYNGEYFIKDLLNSISCSSKLNNFLYELIIVIDSPATQIEEIKKIVLGYESERFVILVYKNECNLGVAKSRNIGFELSSGEYLHFIDQDDRIDSKFYVTAIDLFLKGADLIVFNALLERSDGNKSHLWFYTKPKLTTYNIMIKSLIRSPGQVIFRRSIYPIGGFPEPKFFFGADDKFFWFRLLEQSNVRVKYCKYPFYIARLHTDNFGSDYKNIAKSCLELWDGQFVEKKSTVIGYLDYKLQRYLAGNNPYSLLGFIIYLYYRISLNNFIRFMFK